jgi:hypothetical protein
MSLRSALHAGRRARPNSSGISNVLNAAVDDRFFEKYEYHSITPDQKNTLRLKRLKLGHFGKGHSVNDNGNSSGKGPTIKSLTRSIAELTTKIDKFSLPDDDDDEYEDESSEEEERTSNRSNAALILQSKKKKRDNN